MLQIGNGHTFWHRHRILMLNFIRFLQWYHGSIEFWHTCTQTAIIWIFADCNTANRLPFYFSCCLSVLRKIKIIFFRILITVLFAIRLLWLATEERLQFTVTILIIVVGLQRQRVKFELICGVLNEWNVRSLTIGKSCEYRLVSRGGSCGGFSLLRFWDII